MPISGPSRDGSGFANATIVVRARGGAALTVSNVSWDNGGYGLPNSLQWKVAGLAANTIYDVTISNVTVSGAARNYSYLPAGALNAPKPPYPARRSA